MTLQRYLDKCECVLNKAPTLVFEYQGVMRETALRKAIDILGSRYPVLRARISRDDTGYLLHVPPDSHTDLIVREGGREALVSEASAPWDVNLAVARIILVHDGLCGLLGIRVDNSLFDGASFGRIAADLWQVYTDTVAGKKIVPDLGRLPRGPYEIYKRQGWIRNKSDESGLLKSVPLLASRTDTIQLSSSLNAEETAGLVRAARAHQTTVHAILCGAALTSLRDLADLADETEMACWSMVDLRNHVNPPLGPTEVSICQGMHRAKVTVAASSDPVVIGLEVKKQLKDAMARREVPLAIEYFDTIKRAPLSTPLPMDRANICVSNIVGRTPEFAHPDEIRIVKTWGRQHPKTAGMLPVIACLTDKSALTWFTFCPGNTYDETGVRLLNDNFKSKLVDITNHSEIRQL